MAGARFLLAPELLVGIRGDGGAVGQLTREYGPCAVGEGDPPGGAADAVPAVDVVFGRLAAPSAGGAVVEGGHKTVRWRIALGSPAETTLRVAIELGGAPGSFARSLVQGYFVEPVISIAAARRGLALVPGAAIAGDDGLILVLGRSRAGKSTLAARAMAAGRHVVGDDQVFIDRDGRCRPLPRRLRLYPDIAETTPAAFARLAPATRRALGFRGLVSAVSRGFIRPSLAVDRAELGGSWRAEPLAIRRIVLVERAGASGTLLVEPGDGSMAVGWAADLLAEQRGRLGRAGGAWPTALEEIGEQERAILDVAFVGLPVERVAVPPTWSAPAAVPALARHLGLE